LRDDEVSEEINDSFFSVKVGQQFHLLSTKLHRVEAQKGAVFKVRGGRL
jgi:hypothetical protein